jgi:UrcA family protein
MASGLGFVAPASAKAPITVFGTPQDVPTRTVRYADLNLASAQDQQRLNLRVDSAIRRVCEDTLGGSEDIFDGRACRSASWDSAQPQIALAVQRAQDIAANGFSPIAAVTITIAAPQ